MAGSEITNGASNTNGRKTAKTKGQKALKADGIRASEFPTREAGRSIDPSPARSPTATMTYHFTSRGISDYRASRELSEPLSRSIHAPAFNVRPTFKS